MTISSNTLFHFTKRKEDLLSILKNGFWPQYCKEQSIIIPSITYFIPMVCFCDIPLSHIGRHMQKYGNFGIGLTKNWGAAHRLSPITYLNPESYYYEVLTDTFGLIKDLNRNEQNRYLRYLCFLKPYKIKLQSKWECMYDEREWRYIPKFEKSERIPYWVYEDGIDNENVIKKNNEYLRNKPLKIDKLFHIKYIIIDNENNRLPIIRAIENIFSEQYCIEDIEILKSRILTCQQIQEDF